MNTSFGHEGELSKYANLIKGYQKRYFVIDKEKGLLNYYSSAKIRHKPPKGSISLKNSVLLPSEEDENVFTIHNFENNVHKVSYLKASSPSDRTTWLNLLKQCQIKEKLEEYSCLKEEEESSSPTNQCCICFDNSKEPVATLCGHLFCKSCINQWIDMNPTTQTCPVCHTHINKNKLVRLYGINESSPTEQVASIDNTSNTIESSSNENEVNQVETVTRPEIQVNQRNLHEIQSEYLTQARNQEMSHTNRIEVCLNRFNDALLLIPRGIGAGVNGFMSAFRPNQNSNWFAAIIESIFNFLIAVIVVGAVLIMFFVFIAFWISPYFGVTVSLVLGALLHHNFGPNRRIRQR